MFRGLSLFAAVLVFASVAYAGDVKSGLAPGERIGAFDVVKVAGAEDDGVALGNTLCYRCKYGARPMVMVFSRSTDEKVAGLVKKLDSAVADNSKLKAFVNVLGTDVDAAEAAAKKLGAGSKNVPVVVPVEPENGPADYGITKDAEITVIVAAGGKVVANHALGKGQLNDKAVEAIIADAAKAAQ